MRSKTLDLDDWPELGADRFNRPEHGLRQEQRRAFDHPNRGARLDGSLGLGGQHEHAVLLVDTLESGGVQT